MNKQISLQELTANLGDRLGLRCHSCGNVRADSRYVVVQSDSPLRYAGLLDLIHPCQIQVLGHEEIRYLLDLSKDSHIEATERLFSCGTRLVIVGDAADVPGHFRETAEKHQVALLTSAQASPLILSEINACLSATSVLHANLHGVFMDVHGLGILLTGTHNIGKSELALELISRGHSLIADDAPEFSINPNGTIEGSSPPLLREFLEVRGLGVLNVRAMFGDSAVKSHKTLELVIELQQMTDEEIRSLDRLFGDYSKMNLLGQSVDKISIPVAPGRNLAVLVETAVRNYNLKMKGYDSAAEFVKQQRNAIENNEQ